jgi:very-short-patch-repair endonuclease
VPEGKHFFSKVRRMRAIAQQWSLIQSRRMIYTHSKTLKRARSLRRNQTESEKRLWGYVRDKRLQGHKLNRQVPVGPYIADFLCFEAKLIIEIDGATHGEAHEIVYDERRTAFLEAQGYRVMRCTNMDVFENLTGVLDTILLALEGG